MVCTDDNGTYILYDTACPTSGGDGPSTQGTSTGPTIKISNVSTTSNQAILVQNGIRWIREALKDDEKCAEWLSGGGSLKIGFAFILGELDSTKMAVGVGTFDTPTTNAVAGTSGTDLAPGSMSITVNTGGAFFSGNVTTGLGVSIPSATDAARVFILLHELAHSFGAVGFNQADGGNGDAQKFNNTLVLDKCGALVDRAAGLL